MNTLKKTAFLTLFCLIFPGFLLTANTDSARQPGTNADYPDHEQLGKRLQTLNRNYPGLANLQSLAQTAGNKDIWLLTIGRGNIANKPAIAVVGGVMGDHLLGSELALQFAERLLASSSEEKVKNLLDSMSFYVFPDMSTDAREPDGRAISNFFKASGTPVNPKVQIC